MPVISFALLIVSFICKTWLILGLYFTILSFNYILFKNIYKFNKQLKKARG